MSIPMSWLTEVIKTVITCSAAQYRRVQSCPITQRSPSAHAVSPAGQPAFDQSAQKLTRREISILRLLY